MTVFLFRCGNTEIAFFSCRLSVLGYNIREPLLRYTYSKEWKSKFSPAVMDIQFNWIYSHLEGMEINIFSNYDEQLEWGSNHFKGMDIKIVSNHYAQLKWISSHLKGMEIKIFSNHGATFLKKKTCYFLLFFCKNHATFATCWAFWGVGFLKIVSS